jgi:micrococcal nuclease
MAPSLTRLIVISLCLVLLAACGQTSPPPTPDIEATVQATVRSAIPAAISAPTPNIKTTVGARVQATVESLSRTARVIQIVDGDTLDVVFEDGTKDRIRLLGVDAPETYSANQPYEYGSITDTTCLDEWGETATRFAQFLGGQKVTVVLDPVAGERGSYDRLLAYIDRRGEDFNALLVEMGLARVYTEGEASREGEYVLLQEVAQAHGEGLWVCESGTATSAPSDAACDPSYPTVCIPPPPPDLDCGEIQFWRFQVLPPDPHLFDLDGDGVGCES